MSLIADLAITYALLAGVVGCALAALEHGDDR